MKKKFILLMCVFNASLCNSLKANDQDQQSFENIPKHIVYDRILTFLPEASTLLSINNENFSNNVCEFKNERKIYRKIETVQDLEQYIDICNRIIIFKNIYSFNFTYPITQQQIERLSQQNQNISRVKISPYDLSSTYLNDIIIDPQVDISDITNTREITNFSYLSPLKKLKELTLQGLKTLQGLDGLQNFLKLETLTICEGRLNNLTSLGATTLKELTLQGLGSLETLEGIQNSHNLQTLKIKECDNLENLHHLAPVTTLKELTLQGLGSLETLNGVQNSKRLEKLVVEECKNVVNIFHLESITSLKELILIRLKNLGALTGIQNSQNLNKLVVTKCHQLENIKDLFNINTIGIFFFTNNKKLNKDEMNKISKIKYKCEINFVCLEHLDNYDEIEEFKNTIKSNSPGARYLQNFNYSLNPFK